MAQSIRMQHDTDPVKDLLQKLGNIDDVEVFHNQVMVATYVRPEKTAGGVLLPERHRDEDKFQGKVGLIVKMGPDAFNDPSGKWFNVITVNLHDWIIYRPCDGWPLTIDKVTCRMLEDVVIKGRISRPDRVW